MLDVQDLCPPDQGRVKEELDARREGEVGKQEKTTAWGGSDANTNQGAHITYAAVAGNSSNWERQHHRAFLDTIAFPVWRKDFGGRHRETRTFNHSVQGRGEIDAKMEREVQGTRLGLFAGTKKTSTSIECFKKKQQREPRPPFWENVSRRNCQDVTSAGGHRRGVVLVRETGDCTEWGRKGTVHTQMKLKIRVDEKHNNQLVDKARQTTART